MKKPNLPAASLTLRNAATWPLKKRKAIVAWLRKKADEIFHDPTDLAPRFTARYFDAK